MRIKNTTTTSTEIYLAAREVWSGKAAPGLQIVCKEGIVWVTQPNDLHDYILHPAQRFLATRRGKAVVQALTAATITVIWRHTSRMRSRSVPEGETPLQITQLGKSIGRSAIAAANCTLRVSLKLIRRCVQTHPFHSFTKSKQETVEKNHGNDLQNECHCQD